MERWRNNYGRISPVIFKDWERKKSKDTPEKPLRGFYQEDLVMFLYQEEYYNMESTKPGILECIVEKHRNGEVGTIKFKRHPQYQRVASL